MGDADGGSYIDLGRGPFEDPYADPYEPEGSGDPYSDVKGATWRPIDLGPFVRGEVKRPEPTIGVSRTDGLRLVYAGKEHSVIGEMEAGKSWFSLACVAAELAKGQRVLYVHFEEADPTDTVERLQELGVPDKDILDRLTFAGPNEPVDEFAYAVLLDPAPSLVILDGVNEAMSMNNQSSRDEDGVAVFRRRIVKPATAVGAAVVSCDHVVKDKERRDRGPMGSIHKGNGLTGSLILLENASPFGRQERGASHVFITKDRPGHLRRHGRPNKKMPGKTFIGTLIVDDTRTKVGFLDLVFIEPPEDEPAGEKRQTQDESDDQAVLEAVVALEDAGMQPSLRTVRAKTAGISNSRIDNALTRLVLDGRLKERPGPKNSRLFSVPHPQAPIPP